jgi:flagellar motor component MotA
MDNDAFVKEYRALVERAVVLAEKSRREGLLVLEALIDEQNYKRRGILDYGLRLVIDGLDSRFIDKILSNIIELETDADKKRLKKIEKEAVLAIQDGMPPRLLLLLLNSYGDIDSEAVMKRYNAKL